MSGSNRPLSPHLQVYKPEITSVLSILHRITGSALAAGMFLIAWWLVAAAVSAEYFELINGWLASWFGMLILLGFSVALFYHLCNGIRHLFWDAGMGLEIETAEKTGWLVLVATVALTAIAWAIGLS